MIAVVSLRRPLDLYYKYPDYNFVDYFMPEAVKTTNWMTDTDYVVQEWKMVTGFGVNPFPRIHFVRSDYSLGGPDLVATMKRKLLDKLPNEPSLLDNQRLEAYLLWSENVQPHCK